MIINATQGYKYGLINNGISELLSNLRMNCWNRYTPKQQLLNFIMPPHLDVSDLRTIILEMLINATIPNEAHIARNNIDTDI